MVPRSALSSLGDEGAFYFENLERMIFVRQELEAIRMQASQELKQAAEQKALENLLEGMKGTMADFEIAAINETPIMDIYPYAAEDEDLPPVAES